MSLLTNTEDWVLTYNGDNEYTLDEGENSCWITVGGFSVYVRRREGGHVEVDICPHGDEFEDAPMDAFATSTIYKTKEKSDGS